MGSIGRYIFRITLGAFLVICASVTALMWITQALRDIDLMTNQGQSIFVFIGITGLIIPLLVLIIAPIALMIAVAYVLNKLGNDSELIVMNSAGMPPWVLFRPFLAVGIVVSLLVAAISVYVSPWGLRELRRWATEVRADLVSNIVQPGRFTKLEDKLTLHIRERRPNGQLLGIFIDDLFTDQPNQVRAEFHDRITAPLYPLAFIVMTFAYLGAPRTTRQGRAMSVMGTISAVAALRGLGFAGMIAGVHTPIALLLPYLGLIAAFAFGYFAISRGVIIEPPAIVANAITAVMERIAQRTNLLMGQAP